ncbi:MAG: DHH family phosphoesterase [Candidatus Methanomethylophilaceae archaeon]|nr:DHH family phosphoesterase [Candidatus Methanomethylophilaceae archaeon]MDD3378604.1 DHH family phosphoesterase [Candidatus Methanomethylophilaceae archaeon]
MSMMEFTETLSDKLVKDIARAAKALRTAKTALVITHIDADGITAGSIASITLERMHIEHTIIFEKKITEDTIHRVNTSSADIIWICDLGSAYLSEFKKSNIIITDHHVPDPKYRKKQTFIDGFYEIHHLNPHLYGVNGSYEICGAGMTYLLSREMDPKNTDLAYLGIVGAVGDFQDDLESRLVSYNRIVLKDAIDAGDVIADTDIRFFGRENRPLTQFLQYSSDPELPGITNNATGCSNFYSELNIPLKDNGEWRTWNDLTPYEKDIATEELRSMVSGDDKAEKHLYGEVYTLPKFESHIGLRDAKEYATILNSCGRYDDAETGLRICRGDLTALNDAEQNRSDHRRNISMALSYIKENHLIRERRFIQYFDSGSEIRETIVGIVAGMLLNSNEAKHELPIFAFAKADDGIKVSARATHNLTDKGLDLSIIMKTASEMVGGFGGGHNIAAGATIPEGKEEAFLDIVEDLVSSQVI